LPNDRLILKTRNPIEIITHKSISLGANTSSRTKQLGHAMGFIENKFAMAGSDARPDYSGATITALTRKLLNPTEPLGCHVTSLNLT